jgi:hypothetical protein
MGDKKNNSVRFLFVLVSLLIAGNAAIASAPYCSFRAAGYYPDYHANELPVSQIRFNQLTDIIYFSISPNADGTLNTDTINQDPNTMGDLVQAAKDNNLNTWICVGGAGRSSYFSVVVADPAKRLVLINKLLQFCLNNGFDGIDLDWEPITDPNNYTLLIRELKTTILPHSLSLSVDVYAQGNGLRPEAFESIDWLHVMAYHLHEDAPHSTYEDAVAGLLHWESLGFPRPKMILGLPFFGKDTDLQTINDYYAYKNIINLYHPAPDVDEVAGINFNGIETIKAKTEYVLENNYGGVMFWELTNDTNDPTSLLTAVSETVQLNSPPDFNCDNVIDILDLSDFVTDWFMPECTLENTWCQRHDLDLSATVDLADFALFSQYWKRVLRGDINNDTHVDIQDIIYLAEQWLWTGEYGSIPEDIYIDGCVNFKDFAIIAENWLIQ